jgi:hypothetical protein
MHVMSAHQSDRVYFPAFDRTASSGSSLRKRPDESLRRALKSDFLARYVPEDDDKDDSGAPGSAEATGADGSLIDDEFDELVSKDQGCLARTLGVSACVRRFISDEVE